jgi:hypothetical protein
MISAVLLLYLDELVDEICGDYGLIFIGYSLVSAQLSML